VAPGVGERTVEQQGGVRTAGLPVRSEQHLGRAVGVLEEAIDGAEEEARALVLGLELQSPLRVEQRVVEPVLPRRELGHLAQQLGRFGVEGQGAAVGGQRALQVAVQLELAPHQEVELGRGVRGGASGPRLALAAPRRSGQRLTAAQEEHQRDAEPPETRSFRRAAHAPPPIGAARRALYRPPGAAR
jgi:hypothetical protein